MGTPGRLAQALKVRPKRRAAVAAVPQRPARGGVRRAFAALTAVDIPRGLGASAVALLLLGSVSYGVVRGDHVQDITDNVHELCDATANLFGFQIAEVAVAGEQELSRDRILASAGITGSSSLLFLDAADARTRLLTNPWVSEATVLKLYPGRLRIEIRERKPFALWQRDGKVSLIATDGTVLENYVSERFAALPLVVGEGAERAAPAMRALLDKFPSLAQDVEATVFVAERRWNLRLKGGLDILLPENDTEAALKLLVDLDRTKRLLSRDITVVDMRLPDRVTVRQSDGAAAARDAIVKAQEKARNAKKKGTEA